MAATHLESLNIDKKLDKVSKGFVVVLVEATDHRDESAKQSQEIGSRCINSPEVMKGHHENDYAHHNI